MLMKAITLYQPYASLIAVGVKRFETRSWATNYRGPIAIHAGMKEYSADTKAGLAVWHGVVDVMGQDCWDIRALDRSIRFMEGDGRGVYHDQFPKGAMVATAELVECYQVDRIFERSVDERIYAIFRGHQQLTRISSHERLFGDWTPGRYAWELANVQPLPAPVPALGKQGLWNWEVP